MGAGYTSGDADALVRRATAAVAVMTRDMAICVDRTWATSVFDDHGRFAFYTAREPDVVAELIVALTFIGALFSAVPEVESVDIAMQLAAAPSGPRALVSSERSVSGRRFGKPAGRLVDPVIDVRSEHVDSGRFPLADVQASYPVAEQLLGPWLATFR